MAKKFKTGIEEVIDGWTATFTIGVQTFRLQDMESKKRAVWYKKVLRIAFDNIQNMRWVPATEKTPKPHKFLHLKVRGKNNFGFYDNNENIFECCDMEHEPLEDVEWLEEV